MLPRGLEARTDRVSGRGCARPAGEGEAAARSQRPGSVLVTCPTTLVSSGLGRRAAPQAPVRPADAQGGARLGEDPQLAAFLTGELVSRRQGDMRDFSEWLVWRSQCWRQSHLPDQVPSHTTDDKVGGEVAQGASVEARMFAGEWGAGPAPPRRTPGFPHAGPGADLSLELRSQAGRSLCCWAGTSHVLGRGSAGRGMWGAGC